VRSAAAAGGAAPLDLAADEGADRGAEDGAGGPLAACVDGPAGKSAGSAADDEAGRAVRAAAIEAAATAGMAGTVSVAAVTARRNLRIGTLLGQSHGAPWLRGMRRF
jgi:hypothetical protein